MKQKVAVLGPGSWGTALFTRINLTYFNSGNH